MSKVTPANNFDELVGKLTVEKLIKYFPCYNHKVINHAIE